MLMLSSCSCWCSLSCFFFFSSRRRHTRLQGDWSLDVCSSDLAAAVRAVIALTAAAWQVVVLRVVDRLGKGMRSPPRDALIADVTPAPMVGRAFGLQRGLDHVGAIIGPLVAWVVLSRGADVRSVIMWSIVPGVLVTM